MPQSLFTKVLYIKNELRSYFSLWIKIIKLTVFKHFPFKVGLSFCSINLIALNLNQFQFTLPSFLILLNSLVFIAFKLYCYIINSWFNMTSCHHCQAVVNKKFGMFFFHPKIGSFHVRSWGSLIALNFKTITDFFSDASLTSQVSVLLFGIISCWCYRSEEDCQTATVTPKNPN